MAQQLEIGDKGQGTLHVQEKGEKRTWRGKEGRWEGNRVEGRGEREEEGKQRDQEYRTAAMELCVGTRAKTVTPGGKRTGLDTRDAER